MSIIFSHLTRVRHNTTCFARVAWAYVQSYHGLHRHFGEGTQKNLRPPALWSTRPLCLEADAACHKLYSFYGNGNSNNVCILLHICTYFRLFYMCFRIVLGVFLQAPRMLLMTKWRTKRCKHNHEYQKAWSSHVKPSHFVTVCWVCVCPELFVFTSRDHQSARWRKSRPSQRLTNPNPTNQLKSIALRCLGLASGCGSRSFFPHALSKELKVNKLGIKDDFSCCRTGYGEVWLCDTSWFGAAVVQGKRPRGS